ncbi:MAG TPA: hypothetical protein VNW30_09060 [Opitutaceae bacterium]|nr:hypothetical protein [Opitutaceae bacterium]
MKTKNHQITTRLCAHCGQSFDVNPRLGNRHRYCSKTECARVSHCVAQKKFWKNGDYRSHYTSKDNVNDVRSWRQRNPEYWKRKRPSKRLKNANFVLTKDLSAALRYVALYDTIDTRLALEIGLIPRRTDHALYDTIAKEVLRLIMRGYVIFHNKPDKAASDRIPRPLTFQRRIE